MSAAHSSFYVMFTHSIHEQFIILSYRRVLYVYYMSSFSSKHTNVLPTLVRHVMQD